MCLKLCNKSYGKCMTFCLYEFSRLFAAAILIENTLFFYMQHFSLYIFYIITRMRLRVLATQHIRQIMMMMMLATVSKQ